MGSEVDGILTALADPTRRAIVEALGARPRAAGELASDFGLSPPAMSRHLRVLRLEGLVEEEHSSHEDARRRVYRLRRESFAVLGGWLGNIESFWSGQLTAFRDHAERAKTGKRTR